MTRPPALLFGIPIANVTMDETLDRIAALCEMGHRSSSTFQIATANADFLVNTLDRPAEAGLLQQAELCLPDGMSVVWGGRLLGTPMRERVAGSDLLPLLVERSQTTGQHVHVFGSSEAVAASARELLTSRYPDARFSIDPGPQFDDVRELDDDVVESIRAVGADILCVALGNPKQERFIQAHRDRLGVPVLIGVGGSLDMLVGRRRRAPRWVQRIGMEWVVRAAQEPSRLGRRYAHDIAVFGPQLWSAWRADRRVHGPARTTIWTHEGAVNVTFDAAVRSSAARPVPPTDAAIVSYVAAVAQLRSGARLLVHAPPEPVRQRVLAELVGLVTEARRADTTVTWTGDPTAIERCVDRSRATRWMIGLAD